MNQYTDGGLITTKAYVSPSNYLRKMSDFSAGEWCSVWDSLSWRWIHLHRDFFKENPRMKLMINQIDRLGRERRKEHLAIANRFLERL